MCGGFKNKDVEYEDESGKKGALKLQIWDTAGEERFDSLTKMYFNGAAAAFIVYDITEKHTFEKARKWVHDLEETDSDNQMPVIKFLVGNKIDLISE